jgi:hypothetical protein
MWSAETAAVERNAVIMHLGEKYQATICDKMPPLIEKKCGLKSR